MDDVYGHSIANRDDPVPVVIIDDAPDEAPEAADRGSPGRRRDRIKRSVSLSKLKDLSPSNLKDKLEEAGERKAGSDSIQDRLFNMILHRIVPNEEHSPNSHVDRRSRRYVERPAFSIPLMSNNFRRFNARIGGGFVLQNRLIRLFSWRRPTHTLSLLAIYSFICLNPYLLAVAPLAGTLFFIMVPAFLARHPPPPTSSVDPVLEKEIELYAYPLQGPPVAPARKIRPAPDLSKDFFRNMRDLQNSMEDFSRLHDATVTRVTPLINFSNETVSSALFLVFSAVSCPLFVFAHLLPWRAILFTAGWIVICSGHPTVAKALQRSGAQKTIKNEGKNAEGLVQRFITDDIVVSSSPEQREVEIFELQQRVTSNPSFWSVAAHVSGAPEYEPVLYSSNPYTPLDPTRISGARPKGARFFEDILPPRGWKWAEPKWRLDLASEEWVGERCFSGVEVEVEGDRWVWDIEYEDSDSADDSIADTYEEWAARGGSLRGKDTSKGKGKAKLPSWEEGTAAKGKKGEWRRRRWVRVVERRILEEGKRLRNDGKE